MSTNARSGTAYAWPHERVSRLIRACANVPRAAEQIDECVLQLRALRTDISHQLLNHPDPERPAQSDLRNALMAARTLYPDSATYRAATPRALSTTEPSLHFGSPQQADKSTVGDDVSKR
jgi:hypothetical protein